MNVDDLPEYYRSGKPVDDRDRLLGKFLDHMNTMPDAGEVFSLLRVVHELGPLTAHDVAMLLSLYWEDK